MKITLVVSGWPSDKEPARSVFNKRHAYHLVLEGHKVDVLILRALHPFKKLVESYAEDSINISSVRIIPPFGSFVIKDRISVFLMKLLKWGKIINTDTEVIHCIGGHAAVVGHQLAKFCKSNYLLHYIGGDINCDFEMLLRSRLFRKAIDNAAFHGFESKALHEIFHNKFPGLTNTEVIYRGIKTDVAKFIKTRPGNHLRVLYLGGKPSNGMTKGVFVLLNAISALEKNDVDHTFEFILCGPGILDLDESITLSTNKKIKKIIAGSLTRSAVVDHMVKSDICIIPSYNEGLPNVMWESMIYGCLIVSTRVGGIPEIIESGKDGRLFNIGNSEELSGVLLDIDKHPEQITHMVQSAGEKVKKYDYSLFIEKYLAKYKALSN